MPEVVRVALVISHPIQHFCPQYAGWASVRGMELRVFFGSSVGARPYFDTGFQREVVWDHLNLSQFDHVFLNSKTATRIDRRLDAPELDRRLQEFAPHVVVVHGYAQRLARRASRWAKRQHVHLAYCSDAELRQRRSRFKQVLKFPYVATHFRRIDTFLTVGDANEQYYRHYRVPDQKMIRMHFPIDVMNYTSNFAIRDQLRSRVRRRLGIADDEYVLCTVGKLVPWKSQMHIIDAVRQLEQSGTRTHLFVLGSGEQMGAYKDAAQHLNTNVVHLLGFISPAELPSYYAAADIYVHAACVEPHSLAVSEAVFMGLPVVMSDRCGSHGLTDDVQQCRNGLVYTWGNVGALAACLTRLRDNVCERRRFGEHSHEIAVGFQQRSHVGAPTALRDRLLVK